MINKRCFICDSKDAKRHRRADGKLYKEYLCNDCVKDMIKVGYPIRQETNLK